MIYIILARLGKYKLEVSLHLSYHSSYKHQKSYYILNSYTPSTYSDFFNFTHTVLLFGHVWASRFMAKLARLGNQERRKLSQPDGSSPLLAANHCHMVCGVAWVIVARIVTGPNVVLA